MQFPTETVRQVAQILNQTNLGEISLETPSGTLCVKREPIVAPPLPIQTPAQVEEAREEAVAVAIAEQIEADAAAQITVASPAVGVFVAAKKPLKIGDEIAKKATLGSVETLNIPTDLVAPQNARVAEILVADGQGVEWGQPIFVLEPLP